MENIVKNMKVGFPYFIVLGIGALATINHSAAITYAVVLGVGFILAKELITEIKLKTEAPKPELSTEIKRKIQDLEARMVTMEYEKKMRGF